MAHVLDNPVWNALNSVNSHLGEGKDDVRFFHPDVSPFAAMREDTAANLNALHELYPGKRGMFLWAAKQFSSPGKWTQLHCIPGQQMVFENSGLESVYRADIVPLDESHVPAMLELTTLTKPGPFGTRTIEFGNYEGIFQNDQLVAMTGRRFQCEGHIEASAVCTHPDHLGNGYARRLVSSQAESILAEGKIPYLHVRADNERAIGVYERIGFRKRMAVFFYVLRK